MYRQGLRFVSIFSALAFQNEQNSQYHWPLWLLLQGLPVELPTLQQPLIMDVGSDKISLQETCLVALLSKLKGFPFKGPSRPREKKSYPNQC